MPSYYPSQGTHYSHRSHRSHHSTPAVYAGTHRSHHGVPAIPVAASQAYYPQTPFGGDNVVYVPTHGGSSRHGHHTVAPSYVISSGSRHHGSHHHGSSHSHSHHHHHRRPTLGERIRNFFSFGRRRHQPRYKVKSANSSWGFLGRSRRRRYVDVRTGEEVDRRGRRVYNV